MRVRVTAIAAAGLALALFAVWFSLRRERTEARAAPIADAQPGTRATPPVQRTEEAPAGAETPPNPDGPAVTGWVEDASGGFIAGATVVVTSDDEPDIVIAAAVSGSNGRFRIPTPAAAVRILAKADHYSRAMTRVLAPAQEVRLVLAPGAVLVGRVVERGSGRPIEGAQVTAEKRSGGLDTESVRSGPDGAFRLTQLSPGGYELFAIDSRWRSGSQWAVAEIGRDSGPVILAAWRATRLEGIVQVESRPCSSGSLVLEGPLSTSAATDARGFARVEGLIPGKYALVVQCHGAEEVRESLEIAAGEDPPARRWSLSPGLSVTGVVRTAGGLPVSDAPIAVAREGSRGGRSGTSCASDSSGHFRCSGLSPGIHKCVVTGEHGPRSDTVTVTVGAQGTPSVELRLAGAGDLRIAVVSPAGAPVDRADIVAWRAEEQVATAHRIGPGQFLIRAVPLGLYDVRAGTERTAPGAGARLQRDGEIVSLRLVASSPSLTIAGRVVNEAGKPIADAWVRAARASLPIPELSPGYAPVVTDLDGRFVLTGLVPGPYAIFATTDAGSGEVTDVEAGRSVEIRISSFGEISGVTRNGRGEPVASFRLTWRGADGVEEGRTVFDPTGAWRLPWLKPGVWRIGVEAEGSSAEQEIGVTPGQRAQGSLTLIPRGPRVARLARENPGNDEPQQQQ